MPVFAITVILTDFQTFHQTYHSKQQPCQHHITAHTKMLAQLTLD